MASKLRFDDRDGDRDSPYNNVYSYDFFSSGTLDSMEQLTNFMKADLERAFHLKVSVGKRKIKCLVVTANEQLKKSFSKGGEREENFYKYAP